MVKKGPLSKAEKFYIENNSDMSVDDVANDLKRSIDLVSKHRERTTSNNPSVQIQNVGKLMARKKDKGVTMMTPNASSVADETRKSRIEPDSRTDRPDAIYIINKDK